MKPVEIVIAILSILATIIGSSLVLTSCNTAVQVGVKNSNIVQGSSQPPPAASPTASAADLERRVKELEAQVQKQDEELKAEKAAKQSQPERSPAGAPVYASPQTAEGKLREIERWRNNNSPTPLEIEQTLVAAEEDYPTDYRLPYERAKLNVSLDHRTDRHRAFNILAVAARRAIDSGQAAEMLRRLEGDAEGAFWKLSHGHDEQWYSLIDALEYRDKSRLNVHSH